MLTVVHGIVAAGTVAYLTRGSLKGKRADNSWENIALASNHLFMLTGAALRKSSIELPYFLAMSKAVFILTPVVLLAHLCRKEGKSSSGHKSITINFSRFYYVASMVSALVLLVWGHTGFGLGFFSVLALDGIARQRKVSKLIRDVIGLGALATAGITFLRYAFQLKTMEGRAVMMVIATEMFLPKLMKLLPDHLPSSRESYYRRSDSDDEDYRPKWRGYGYPPIYCRDSEGVPSKPSSPSNGKQSLRKDLDESRVSDSDVFIMDIPHDM